jgi:hypothetical protein
MDQQPRPPVLRRNDFLLSEQMDVVTRQCVVPVFATIDGNFLHLGSAFIVNPAGIMMTAAHVLHSAQIAANNHFRCPNAPFGLYVLYMTGEQGIGGPMPIDLYYAPHDHDVAVMVPRRLYKEGKPYMFPIMRLSLAMPPIGSHVSGIGYPKWEVLSQGDLLATERTVSVKPQNAYTTGVVVDTFPRMRDRGMFRFPCFQIDARFEGGMSGGPVMNEAGDVCGVVCGKLDGTPWTSFVAAIWPALGTEMRFAAPDGTRTYTTIYDLIKQDKIACDGSIEGFEVRDEGAGVIHVTDKALGFTITNRHPR